MARFGYSPGRKMEKKSPYMSHTLIVKLTYQYFESLAGGYLDDLGSPGRWAWRSLRMMWNDTPPLGWSVLITRVRRCVSSRRYGDSLWLDVLVKRSTSLGVRLFAGNVGRVLS